MTAATAKPATVTEYINAAPREARTKLREMRKCVKAAAPGAVEGIKWGMPAYSYRRILVTFAGFRHHVGFYPTPSVMTAFTKELAEYVTAKGSVQFPHDQPLPLKLIARMTAHRVRESVEEDGKWRS